MATPISPHLVHLPVRVLDTLTAGGGRAQELVVACPMRGGAIDLDTCRVCPRLTAIDIDLDSTSAVVHCSVTTDAPAGNVGGCSLARGVPSVREDVTLQELASFFVQQGLPRVAVVDSEGKLLGIIAERDLIVDEILEYRHRGAVPASHLARKAHAVSEATTLRDALRTMAHHQLREVPVVNDDGRFTGWLEDIEALHGLRTG